MFSAKKHLSFKVYDSSIKPPFNLQNKIFELHFVRRFTIKTFFHCSSIGAAWDGNCSTLYLDHLDWEIVSKEVCEKIFSN